MSHQILGLRPYFLKEKGETIITDATFFKRDWRFENIEDLFSNLPEYLENIPEEERWNLFYTVARCTEEKRKFKEQNVLIFDVDKIILNETASGFHIDETPFASAPINPKYIEVVCNTLGVKPSETGVVYSGNGLHFIIRLNYTITDPDFFKNQARHYKAICEKIEHALERENLPGKADPAVFDARRIMRLPGTINRKDDKEDKVAVLMQPRVSPVLFILSQASGLPDVEASDHISPHDIKKKPRSSDTQAVLEGCQFLRWCKENPNDVSEAQWYGMLSILPRLTPNGRELAHEYSSGHHSYSYSETESKIDQALEASGPRTCQNLDKLAGKCQGCPHQGEVNSPIMIQGPDFIKTQDTGFHTFTPMEGGRISIKPCYEDLRRFFEREHPYITLGASGICYIYNGKHWEEMEDRYLEAYAQDRFNPKALTKMTQEFKNLICRTNLIPSDRLKATTDRKINFQNGVLDVATMQLGPHSKEYGFTYVLPYDYDPLAKAPMFEKFLDTIMLGRQDLVRVILEFAGYALSNDPCWAQKAMIFIGVGSNGKSTLMNVIKKLAGEQNYSSLTLSDLKKDTNRVHLDGKLFNMAEETSAHAIADSSLFKNLTTGGTTTAKKLYKQSYEFANRCKLIFACNELPKSKDTTNGLFRRMLIIPFEKEFVGEEKDSFIEDKLLTELPGIFNMVVEGYSRLRRQRAFTESNVLEEQIRDYQKELDTVRSWFEDCVEVKPIDLASNPIPVSSLYSSYTMYVENDGDNPENKATFVRRLTHLLRDSKKRKVRQMVKGRREFHFYNLAYADGSNNY